MCEIQCRYCGEVLNNCISQHICSAEKPKWNDTVGRNITQKISKFLKSK
jgi:hypothetical protein